MQRSRKQMGLARVNDPTVAALWPDRLASAKPKMFVNFPCTWQSFPGHQRCCFTGYSQHHALKSIYEWTLITSIWSSNSPHITANQLSWFYTCGNPGHPHHEGGCSIYSRPTTHRMALLDASNLVWWMRPCKSWSVCAQGENVQFQTQL